jgi:hypothetical protein
MNTYKNIKDEGLTDAWLRSAGIDSKRLTAERIELQHAQRLATQMLKQNRAALAQNQAHSLENFLAASKNGRTCKKITQCQCYKVLNIAKQAQRTLSKQRKKTCRLC